MNELSSNDEQYDKSLIEDVFSGLTRDPKQLPSRLFYDEKGSELFNRICELDEYYVTRAELRIMENNIKDISSHAGKNVLLIELGSGSSVKTRILLDNLIDPAGYVPVDISYDHLFNSVESLKEEYSQLKIYPLVADFTNTFKLPLTDHDYSKKVVYFPGSTIGNLMPDEAQELLKRISGLCGNNGGLLIGIDLQKDNAVLEAAYNDSSGVTAEFNLNMLSNINNNTGSDFNLSLFSHCAFYNETENRIEMHLISKKDQTIHLNDKIIELKKNERIITEYSYKYTIESFMKIAGKYFKLVKKWTDDKNYFAVLYLEVI
jgi:dimethylhistidine N-methyltransferase